MYGQNIVLSFLFSPDQGYSRSQRWIYTQQESVREIWYGFLPMAHTGAVFKLESWNLDYTYNLRKNVGQQAYVVSFLSKYSVRQHRFSI